MGCAENLSKLMKHNNISMYRLAKEVDVHQTTVKNWLDGESEPKIAALKKMVKLFGVSYDELLGTVDFDSVQGENGAITFSDDGSPGLTLVQLGVNGRDGVAYLPDALLLAFVQMNRDAVETVCDVATRLARLPACQRPEVASDYLDPDPPESAYDLLEREYHNYKGRIYKPSRDITKEPFGADEFDDRSLRPFGDGTNQSE